MRTPLAACAAVLLALGLPAAAGAHVTVQPTAAPEGGFARLDVRVPNERDDQGTVKVDMKLPPGVIAAAYEPVPGWSTKVARERLKTPIEVDGLAVSDQVARVTWTADRHREAIRPGQFRDFGLSLSVPQGKPGDTLPFKALQTYEGGEIVRWIGPSDSDEPAPTLTLTASGAGGGHGAPDRGGRAGLGAGRSGDGRHRRRRHIGHRRPRRGRPRTGGRARRPVRRATGRRIMTRRLVLSLACAALVMPASAAAHTPIKSLTPSAGGSADRSLGSVRVAFAGPDQRREPHRAERLRAQGEPRQRHALRRPEARARAAGGRPLPRLVSRNRQVAEQ